MRLPSQQPGKGEALVELGVPTTTRYKVRALIDLLLCLSLFLHLPLSLSPFFFSLFFSTIVRSAKVVDRKYEFRLRGFIHLSAHEDDSLILQSAANRLVLSPIFLCLMIDITSRYLQCFIYIFFHRNIFSFIYHLHISCCS